MLDMARDTVRGPSLVSNQAAFLLVELDVRWLGLVLMMVSAEALKSSPLSRSKVKTTTLTPSTQDKSLSEEEEPSVSDSSESNSLAPPSGNATTKSPLTGIPQLDYIHDPNLPRELNGYNLTDYPFFDRVPEVIDFKCDGLHDGFYASVTYKCQSEAPAGYRRQATFPWATLYYTFAVAKSGVLTRWADFTKTVFATVNSLVRRETRAELKCGHVTSSKPNQKESANKVAVNDPMKTTVITSKWRLKEVIVNEFYPRDHRGYSKVCGQVGSPRHLNERLKDWACPRTVYHHCLYGTRYDFLCANFTAFDQRTFICHFASEVDCINSPKFFKRKVVIWGQKELLATSINQRCQTFLIFEGSSATRKRENDNAVSQYCISDAVPSEVIFSVVNSHVDVARNVMGRQERVVYSTNEALYKETTTTSTTTVAPPTPPPTQPPPPRRASAGAGRRRRPGTYRRRRPAYDYYYEDEYEDDVEYEDDKVRERGLVRGGNSLVLMVTVRKQQRPQQQPADDVQNPPSNSDIKSRPSGTLYDRPRSPPKVRRPVPLNEREKYDYSKHPSIIMPEDQARDSNPRGKQPADDEEYYDDEEEYVTSPRGGNGGRNRDPYPSATDERDYERRPPKTGSGMPLRRNRGPSSSRKRVSAVDTATPYAPVEDDYDDMYDDEPRRAVRPSGGRKRPKQPLRQDDDYRRPTQTKRPFVSSRYEPEDEEILEEAPVPAPRPAFISTAPQSGRQSFSARRRPEVAPPATSSRPSNSGGYRRPVAEARDQYSTGYGAAAEDEEYYDEEEVEEPTPVRGRPRKPASSGRTSLAGSQYRPTALDEDVDPPISRVTATNKRPFVSSDRSNSPSVLQRPQSQPQQSYSNKPQPSRDYSPSGLEEVSEERPRSPTTSRDRVEDDVRNPSPQVKQSNFRNRDPVPITTPEEIRPVSFTQSNYRGNTRDVPDTAQPLRQTEYRSKPTTEEPFTSRGKYRAGSSSDVFPVSAPPTEELLREDPVPPSSRGSYSRPPAKLVMKQSLRERENVRLVPEEVPLRHNLADVSDSENDVALNDALQIPVRDAPSGPAFLQSGDGQPRFRVKLLKTKVPQPQAFSAPTGGDTESASSTGYGGSSGIILLPSASQTQITRAPADDSRIRSRQVQETTSQRQSYSGRKYAEPLSLSASYDRRPQQERQSWRQQSSPDYDT
uniref:Chitin-binding type-2 domain-containing protein n=1 Tax=Timema tahoe TaxID=61484 RepID=A0A7R9NVT8_9NEOP|nr:unnamed protein product [Timema tahoe]